MSNKILPYHTAESVSTSQTDHHRIKRFVLEKFKSKYHYKNLEHFPLSIRSTVVMGACSGVRGSIR